MSNVAKLRRPLTDIAHLGGATSLARGGQSVGKPRILHAVFSSNIAGAERYCVDLANQQSRLGYEVHVAGRTNSPLEKALMPGVTYHSARMPFLLAGQLSRIIARNNIDVCHAHLSSACKALSRGRNKIRKVATLHVGYKAHQHARLDGLICVNNAQIWRLGGFTGKTRVISNWLPTPSAIQASVDLHAHLGLARDTLLIGAVGRLHRSKGCDVLISAFRNVAPANAALIIVGEGPEKKRLKQLCEGDRRIFFLGVREDVAAVMRNFDLFVSPSRVETFGLAILEAMDAGLPIIATETDGPGDYLRRQPATLIEPGSIGAMSQALARHIYRPPPPPHYDTSPFDPTFNVRKILEFYGGLRGEEKQGEEVRARRLV